MAPKKAAKKVAKKAAKKAVGPGRRGQDMRRCYEHFGRVMTLNVVGQRDQDTLSKLLNFAKAILDGGDARNAADILRAAEHFAFGTLAATNLEEEAVSDELRAALEEEYDHLLTRANDNAIRHELSPAVVRLVEAFRKAAAASYRAKRLRAASELARGMEALTHVHVSGDYRLKSGAVHYLLTP